MSVEFFSRIRIKIEEQMRILSTFAAGTNTSKNDKDILLKAEYYLLRLSHVLYVNKIDSTLFRLRESQKAFLELYDRTESLPLRDHYQRIIGLLSTIQSELFSITLDENKDNEGADDPVEDRRHP